MTRIADAVVSPPARLFRSVAGPKKRELTLHLKQYFRLHLILCQAVSDEGAQHVAFDFLVWSKSCAGNLFRNAKIVSKSMENKDIKLTP
jgi:hypothetical protein